MRNIVIFLMMGWMLSPVMQAQTIPADSLYLGQTPPGTNPVIFHLPVAAGSFAAERIAVSGDNKEIYYTGIRNYYPTRGDTIKYYRYSGDRWTGPFNLFDNYIAPALTVKGDSMFCQDNSTVYKSYCSVRSGTGWSLPTRVMTGLNSAHYLQKTRNGNFYISSIPGAGLGGNDWCRLEMNGADTAAVCLGLPVSSGADNLDFFVARDESFMILAKGRLMVTYPKSGGGWTNPKDLGAKINFGMGMWGPYVSADHKYLFYTTGTKPDYSDTYVYWVRVDGLIDSLRHTNFLPYLRNPVSLQNTGVGRMFRYPVPDSTFIDDDGNNTLSFSAKLSNGTPLPEWLSFDTVTAAFSGIPSLIQILNVRLTAKDNAGASVSTTFKISVGDTTSVDQPGGGHGLRVYPNPVSGRLRVSREDASGRPFRAEIRDLQGKLIRQKVITDEEIFDLTGISEGVYILKAILEGDSVYERICVF
ncbi:MAG TPA: putative Ig domain-containing protein [Bacteroidales bacterium]|nr:putative Ig domain-containing protein [Bacteroidales bacterium]HPS62123.1 putative Ig domain-containing protein [Bacteroidales bacterium]